MGSPYRELHSRIVFGVLAHSHNWGASEAPERQFSFDLYGVEPEHPREEIDIVYISDLGTWSAAKISYQPPREEHPIPAEKVAEIPEDLRCVFDSPDSKPSVGTFHVRNTALYVGSAPTPFHQVKRFTPIDAMVTHLMHRFAWDVPELRPLAEYFSLAGVGGYGGGQLREWAPEDTYHEETLDKIIERGLDATREALSSSQAEAAQLAERIERQAVESAKDKVTLQKHFNEYKDRLVTMSDERRLALKAQREAEKQAAALEKQVSESEQLAERVNRELIDSRDEVRLLTEALGEARGELSTLQARLSEQLADRDTQLKTLQNELETVQLQVREYARTDRSLVQALIDERQSARV